MGTKTDSANPGSRGRKGRLERRELKEMKDNIKVFDDWYDTHKNKSLGKAGAGLEGRSEGTWQPNIQAESEDDIPNKMCSVGREEIRRYAKSGKKGTVREQDAKEAEGSTPSESATYASKVAGGGANNKSRLWGDECSKADEREKTGEETERARGLKENVETRMAETREKERNRWWRHEMRERRNRTRNVVVRGMVEEDEEVKKRVERWLERELGRRVEIEQIRVEKENLVIVRLKWMKDVREVLEQRVKIWEHSELWVDRDRTFTERRNRWVVSERSREERRKGRKVIEEDDRVNIDGTWWYWIEKGEEWLKEDKEAEWTEKMNSAQAVWRKEDVVRWRADLERRKEELRKEEEKLVAEEKKVVARVEIERASEVKKQEEVKKGKEGKQEVRKPSSKQKQIEGERGMEEKEVENKKTGLGEKRETAYRVTENQYVVEIGNTGKKPEDLGKWRVDLERRKEEMRKEEEKLKEVERIVLGKQDNGSTGDSILSDVGD